MRQENVVDLKRLIDVFDSDYYEIENQLLQEQIFNIRNGQPRFKGIYDYSDNYIVPKDKVEKEIKILEKRIKENKKTKKELNSVLSQLKSSADKLENLAKENFLLDRLQSYISHRNFLHIERTEVFNENVEKYRKLY